MSSGGGNMLSRSGRANNACSGKDQWLCLVCKVSRLIMQISPVSQNNENEEALMEDDDL